MEEFKAMVLARSSLPTISTTNWRMGTSKLFTMPRSALKTTISQMRMTPVERGCQDKGLHQAKACVAMRRRLLSHRSAITPQGRDHERRYLAHEPDDAQEERRAAHPVYEPAHGNPCIQVPMREKLWPVKKSR